MSVDFPVEGDVERRAHKKENGMEDRSLPVCNLIEKRLSVLYSRKNITKRTAGTLLEQRTT
ncbi:hypothetical protein WN48_05126 [Eufriesea mexicana]|nr:hypothetical protein WN48_05126 [Eufriesea mexicana]